MNVPPNFPPPDPGQRQDLPGVYVEPPAKKKRGPKFWLLVVGAVVVVGGIIGAATGHGGSTTADRTVSDADASRMLASYEAANAGPPTIPPAAPAAGTIPSPSAEETTDLYTALTQIDPTLVDKHTVSNARNTCQRVLSGDDQASIVKYVQQEWQDGDTDELTAFHAQQIMATVRNSSWCH